MLNQFRREYRPTLGADFLTKEVTLDDKVTTLQIWDSAGTERFRSLGTAFYRGADAVILVFNVNNAGSFEHLDFWRDEFLANATPSNPDEFPFILVGNKADEEGSREVSRESIDQWCQSKGGIPYFETSTKLACSGRERAFEESQRIQEAFMLAAQNACPNDNPEEPPESSKTKHDCVIS